MVFTDFKVFQKKLTNACIYLIRAALCKHIIKNYLMEGTNGILYTIRKNQTTQKLEIRYFWHYKRAGLWKKKLRKIFRFHNNNTQKNIEIQPYSYLWDTVVQTKKFKNILKALTLELLLQTTTKFKNSLSKQSYKKNNFSKAAYLNFLIVCSFK